MTPEEKKKIRGAAYYAANKEQVLKRKAAYRAANKERIKAADAVYRAQHKEQAATWRRENKEQIATYLAANAARIAARDATYRAANKERRKATRAAYLVANKEELAARRAAYRSKNKARILKYKAARHKVLMRVSPSYKLQKSLRERAYRVLKLQRTSKTFQSHIRLLGCTLEHARKHIESQFEPWMSWENHSPKGWHVDHVKPLASFDLADPAQVKQAFHYTNLRPLHWRENIVKGARLIKN